MKKIQQVVYKIKTKKSIHTRIVQISDLHYYHEKDLKLFKRIEEKIKKIKPDYICITGDFLDNDKVDASKFIEWINELRLISPILISIGNHDTGNVHLRTLGNSEKVFRKLNRIEDVYVLDNKKKEFTGITFTGITILNEGYRENKQGDKLFIDSLKELKIKKIDPTSFNVILCHSPFVVVNKEAQQMELFKKSDLILSGHTHGGLTPKWLYNFMGKRSILSPRKRLLSKYSQGYYSEYHLIINTATKKLSHTSSLEWADRLTSTEITIIDINK